MILVCYVILQYHVSKGVSRSCLNVSQHPTMFGGHKNCGNASIMVLVCHLSSQDHVTKGSCDFMKGSLSR